MNEIKIGDRVRISPQINVYGLLTTFIGKTGTVSHIKEFSCYTVAHVKLDDPEQSCVIQTKHLSKI